MFKHFIENPRAAMKNRETGRGFALTSQPFHLKGSALKEIDVGFFLVPESGLRLERISPLKQYFSPYSVALI